MHRPLSAKIRGSAIRATLAMAGSLALLPACGAKAAPTSQPCDQKCQDGVVLRGLRDVLKFAYNLTVAGKPVGHQEGTAIKFPSGTVHVFGEATSNADQGLTTVGLTYELHHCVLRKVDDTPNQNYDLVFDGTITQNGNIAVQPTSSTALMMSSEGITLSGSVYDPPIRYPAFGVGDAPDADAPDAATEITCPIEITQNGNNVSGKLCGRNAGFDF